MWCMLDYMSFYSLPAWWGKLLMFGGNTNHQPYSETSELQHDKTNIMSVCPAKTQLSLSAQSDQSPLCPQWVAKDPRFLHADSEDFDQTGWMPRLIRVFAGRTHFVSCVMSRLSSLSSSEHTGCRFLGSNGSEKYVSPWYWTTICYVTGQHTNH